MDGLVVVLAGLFALWVTGFTARAVMATVIRRVLRALPDPALPRLGHHFNRGCDTFDRRKFLELRLAWARRDLAAATTHYRALRTAIDGAAPKLSIVPIREVR